MTRWPTILATVVVLLGVGASTVHAQGIQPQADLVNSWYVRYLGRNADAAGIDYWGRQLICGKPAVVVLSGIIGSDEYFHRNGCNPTGFVLGLYADVLGRGATQPEVNYWLHKLQGCRMHRQRLAQQFLQAATVELVSTPRPQVMVVPPPTQTQPPPPQPLPYP